jgi:aminopeptidase-like protein
MRKNFNFSDKKIVSNYYNLAKTELSQINRSITGKGTLKLLNIIKKDFKDLKICKIRSGEKIFDWKVPSEWNVSAAYVVDKYDKKIINLDNNNLHLLGYSMPINKIISKRKLITHLYSLPNQPNAIPYLTSYYQKNWGFCVTDKQKKNIIKKYNSIDKFKVVINSSFNNQGYLNYGELLLKGKSKQEILISTYICHPSMANDELSGTIASMSLIKYYKNFKELNKSLRFIFVPETIGSIAYLSKNLNYLKSNLIAGYNLTCIGDEKKHSCMLSKYRNTQADYSLMEAYKKLNIKYKEYNFLKRGSDERQFNSPGIDLPIASIFRSKYGEFPEYHTSLDNFELVTKKGLIGGFKVAKTAINLVLKKIIPINLVLCEPQMGKRGLYPMVSKKDNTLKKITRHYMNFLQYSDGKNDLEIISKIINLDKNMTLKIYNILKKHKLVA